MTGRVDIFITELARAGCAHVQKNTGVDLWEQGGVKRIVAQAIEEWKIPKEPIDIPMTLARNVFGILPEAPPKSRTVRVRAAKNRHYKNPKERARTIRRARGL